MSENVGFAGQIGPEHVGQVVKKALNLLLITVLTWKVVQNNQPVLKLKKQPSWSRLCLSACCSWQITELDVRTFANHYNELPKPVLMFCRTGNRSNNLYQLAKQMDLLDD